MTEELKSGTTEIAEYSEIDGAIAGLQEKYGNKVYDVTKPEGMEIAVADRREVKKARTTIEKIRKEIKAPALARCRDIDSEARRISEALFNIEKPIDDIIKKEQSFKAELKAAKQRSETERVAKHQAVITAIQQYPMKAIGKTSVEIQTIIDTLDAEDLSTLEDFKEGAEVVKRTSREMLVAAMNAVELKEKEAEQLAAAAKEENERLEKENAEKQAELDTAAAVSEREKIVQDKVAADKSAQDAKDRLAAAEAKQAQDRREALLEARCETQGEALAKVLEICKEGVGDPVDMLNAIEVICEANLEV